MEGRHPQRCQSDWWIRTWSGKSHSPSSVRPHQWPRELLSDSAGGRGPHNATPHSWNHHPVSLSWENKWVDALIELKDWNYNFKWTRFWSSSNRFRDWDQKGQVGYIFKASGFSFQVYQATKTRAAALSWLHEGGRRHTLALKALQSANSAAKAILCSSKHPSVQSPLVLQGQAWGSNSSGWPRIF